MRIALISDHLTSICLARELSVSFLGPYTGGLKIQLGHYDFMLVESCWSGNKDGWKYRIASYPAEFKRNNNLLRRLVERAKDQGIPTVFWNKEDSVHYERFIDSARLFDYVFTVDENCIPRYRRDLNPEVKIESLMFAVQPRFHSFTGFNFKHRRANFVGSYSHHVHDRRRSWQNMLFHAASPMGLTVFDRNSSRSSANYRYPSMSHLHVRPALSHEHTGRIYKDYLVSLNVNTVEDSPTMYSRRLVEILACGGIAVTSPARSIETYLKDFCHVVSCSGEAADLFARLQRGPNSDDLERARAGAEYVLKEHTWEVRLRQIASSIGIQ